ncbi:MAG: response regulator [Gemmatimonadota bacterium]
MARILVVDDEPGLRDVIRRGLERAGHAVLLAGDGDAGLRLYEQQGADLVILDIFMPERDGIDLMLRLRAAVPQPKIIAMSGGGRRQHVDVLGDATLLGAARTFMKPFAIRELVAAVDALLNNPASPGFEAAAPDAEEG